MKYIYTMQNMTFGEDEGLDPKCAQVYPNDLWKCFMAPHIAALIETPYFLSSSK